MSKGKQVPVNKVANKIPILSFGRNGVFETAKNFFTEMYVVELVKIQDAEIFKHRINKLYLEMPNNVVFQMVVHNTLIPKEEYLQTVLVPQGVYSQAEVYNRTLLDAMDIGCNNVKKCVYFVVGHKDSSLEQASKFFEECRGNIEKAFGTIRIRRLSTMERLKMLYHVFNPKKNAFANEIDLKNDGHPDLEHLKYMHMTEKDLIAPGVWNISQNLIDYTILDEGQDDQCYSRSLFLNCIPREVSINVVSDLTSVASNMLFSVFYHPVDVSVGFEESSEQVKKNTVVTRKQKRETIQDKKNHTMITFTERKEINEDVYFHEAALDTTKGLVASGSTMMEASILITLFADNLEELDRNTEMLRISAAKFACSVKTLDMLQKEAFCSTLPFCRQSVNVSRFLSAERLAQISPITAAATGKAGGAFYGLNAINDNLICMNRKQGVNLSGVITGAEHSGKTYQMKREIMNSVLTTDDYINLVTLGEEYDEFICSLNGEFGNLPFCNPFCMTDGYGLTSENKAAKELFLTAFGGSREEARSLLAEQIDFSYIAVMEAVLGKYPGIQRAYQNISGDMVGNVGDKRLTVYHAKTQEDYLAIMEYLWNKSIEDKKNNKTNWIFLDKVDMFLEERNGDEQDLILPYLLKYLKASSDIRNVVTVLVQDAVGLMAANVSSAIAVEELVSSCGYVKLLNQGPIERKRFTDVLNIPNALLPYITYVEPGQGLIITPVSNVAFNDNFLEKGNEFTRMFQI